MEGVNLQAYLTWVTLNNSDCRDTWSQKHSVLKLFPHVEDSYRFSPKWILWWTFSITVRFLKWWALGDKILGCRESLVTCTPLMGHFSCLYLSILLHMTLLIKSHSTLRTLTGLFSCVYALMNLGLWFHTDGISASWAFVRFVYCVYFLMCLDNLAKPKTLHQLNSGQSVFFVKKLAWQWVVCVIIMDKNMK